MTVKLSVAALSVMLAGGVALAQAPAAPAKPVNKPAPAAVKKEVKPAVVKFQGTVEAVDSAANKLSVKNKKGEVKEFVLAAGTMLTKHGKKIAIAEVAAGDMAAVTSHGADVKSIAVTAKKK